MNPLSVCVIGDAMTDIIVPTNNIVRGGAFNRNIKIRQGGTANVAVWLSRLGCDTKFFGKVGEDQFGSLFENTLINEKVSPLIRRDTSNETGICIALVDSNGERTMVTSRGANDNITKKDIRTELAKILESDMLYFSGFSLITAITRESILYLLKRAHKRNEVWFNVGAPNIITPDFYRIIKKYSDALILNLDEAKVLTKKENIEEIQKKLQSISDTTILTMGASGSIVSSQKNSIFTPANKIKKIIDTTGAGDAFAAAFIAGKAKGLDFKKCSELGHSLAAKVIQREGAR